MTTDRRFPLGTVAWSVALLLIVAVVAQCLGIFAPTIAVPTAQGVFELPNALASVDHPFHIARAELLRRSLAAGELPRWIANHQGGYPIEFYPLGVAWLEVVVWAMGFGFLTISAAHTIVVTLVFLLPVGAFLLLARQDGWGPRPAIVAVALHVMVPGDWWHGGYTELVQWGLITNVTGAVLALYFLACLSRFVLAGTRWAGALAIVIGAGAVYCNPRSVVALAVAGVAVGIAAIVAPGISPSRLRLAAQRLTLVAVGGGLLAAPQIGSLVRFSDLYAFVRYERYDDLTAYVASSAAAVSGIVFGLAVLGGAWGLLDRRHQGAKAVALALLLYVGLTGFVSIAPDLVTQLEATRLMPFQRLLAVYLAATVVERGVRRLRGNLPRRGREALDIALAGGVAVLFLARLAPSGLPAPVPTQTDPAGPTLYPVTRAAVPQQADLEAAVRAADAAAPPGTALLVIGSALSWHQQLWAPLWTDRPLMYDDWLWGWNRAQIGTPGYRWEAGNAYPDPAATLAPDYLARYGIGAVVVTGPVADVAAGASELRLARPGTYATYLVAQPTRVVTFDGANPTAIDVEPQHIIATGPPAEAVRAQQSWFPRWQATVNDEAVAAGPGPGAMIAVAAESRSSSAEVELRYGTTGIDWMLRGAAAGGLALALWLLAAGSWRRRPPTSAARSAA